MLHPSPAALAHTAASWTSRPWQDANERAEDELVCPLTAEQAQALRLAQPVLNPWRVVAGQALVGLALSLLVGLLTGSAHVAMSMLYGASCAVVPALLLVRGLSSPLSRLSPAASASSFVVWALVKLLVALVMLILANHILKSPSWPALLVGLVVCIKVHAWSLLWRPRLKSRG